MAPIDTLGAFLKQLRDLDPVQNWINETRILVPNDRRTKLHMDRRQRELNARRAEIVQTMEQTMAEIASRN